MAQQCLLELMSIIPDPRAQDDRLRHKLIDILVITVCGVLSGCESFGEIEDYACTHEDWLREFLELPNGIPSHDTLARVFSILDFEAFAAIFWQWVDIFKLAPVLTGLISAASRGRTRC